MPEHIDNGRLPQCIEFQARNDQLTASLCREIKDMKISNEHRDRAIEDLRLTLARWGGVIAALTVLVGILGPVIARVVMQ